VGSAGRIPSRLVCETNLPEGRDRKIPTDLNQKTKTKNHCLLETKLRLEQGRPRHFWKITICPTKIAISSTIRSTTLRYSKRAGRAFRLVSRSTGTCLADVNGNEVEAYLLESRRAALTSAVADAPANWASTRIIMSNAWQDPEVPARSATIKPTQAIWQNSSR